VRAHWCNAVAAGMDYILGRSQPYLDEKGATLPKGRDAPAAAPPATDVTAPKTEAAPKAETSPKAKSKTRRKKPGPAATN
jgi:hypothetical protein